MWDKAVDNFLPTLKFVPDQFVTQKMIIKLYNTLFTVDVYSFDGDSGNVKFLTEEVGILSVNLHNISLDDANLDEDDFETIIRVRLLAWHKKLKQLKTLKKKYKKN